MLALIVALLTGSVIVITTLRDWRAVMGALLGQYIAVALVIRETVDRDVLLGSVTVDAAVIVTLVVGVTVVAILTITAVNLNLDQQRERAAKAGETRALVRPEEAPRYVLANQHPLLDYFLPLCSAVIALAAAYALSRVYPIGDSRFQSFVFYLLELTGLFILIFAHDLLRLGLALLIFTSGMSLLYIASAQSLSLVGIYLVGAVSILLALAIVYLCTVLYVKMGTLEVREVTEK